MTELPKTWREVKAKLIARYGSITEAAAKIGHSTSALKYAATSDKCPGVRAKMEKALANVTV